MLPTCAIGFVRTDPGLLAPNLQISCTAAADDTRPYLPFAVPRTPDGFSIRAILLRPLASGALKLVNSDPLKDPVVQQGRNAPVDDRTLAQALTTIEAIASQPAMANIIDGPALSKIPKQGDARLEYIRRDPSKDRQNLTRSNRGALPIWGYSTRRAPNAMQFHTSAALPPNGKGS